MRRCSQEPASTSINSKLTAFEYDQGQMVSESDAAGVLLRRYVYGAASDVPLVVYGGAGTGNKSWLYRDQLGSVIATANASGVRSVIYSYGPFGETSTGGLRFRYTGQWMIDELGLYYYKARFYSAGLGRFLQADPIGYRDDLNPYAYVSNNPINRTDPTGLFGIDAKVGAGALAQAAGSPALGPDKVNSGWKSSGAMSVNRSGLVSTVTMDLRYGASSDPALVAATQTSLSNYLNGSYVGLSIINVDASLLAADANHPQNIVISPCGSGVDACSGAGKANQGSNKVWLNTSMRPDTPAHEVLHAAGLHHSANGSGSIMSYDANRQTNWSDAYRLQSGY